MNTIEARHPGLCTACDESFDVGEPLTRNAEDTAWVHVTCPEPPAPRPVCPECFMEIALNGACSCP